VALPAANFLRYGQLLDGEFMNIRLFIKPGCPWCHQARRWLDQRRLAYELLDVIADEAAFDMMRRLSGQTRAPVIEVDGRVLADFGEVELAGWWPQQGFDNR
jgi:glutaredoxin 3